MTANGGKSSKRRATDMWGEIAGAAASLLGGLFGKKKQQTTTKVNYRDMVAEAEAAGINPLTAIRNGGSAGFTTTTAPTVSAMPEILGNLGGVLGNALDKKLDPIEAKRREIDTILLDRQLGQLKMGPELPASFKTPRTYTGVKNSQQLAPRVGPSATQKSASVPANFIGPPSPQQFVKDNKGLDLYVPVYDRFNNKVHYFPNPDLPDADQMVVPSIGIVGSETRDAVGNFTNRYTPKKTGQTRQSVPQVWRKPSRPFVPSPGKGR